MLLVVAPAMLLGGGWLFLRDYPSIGPFRPDATAADSSSPPRPVAPPAWTASQLQDLLAAIERADAEGLRASDYHVGELRAAAGEQPDASISALADRAALALAHDCAAGRVRNRHRFNWYVDASVPKAAELTRGIVAARTQGKLKEWLEGLLPTAPAYRALRDALASTSPDDTDQRDRIRANMERWRWLPRDFGHGDQLYVNLPTYRLEVVQDGRTIASYRAVIGATDMPTPALSAPLRQVIANPDWIVPQSIVRRSHLRPGASSKYTFTTRPDGTVRVRQKPGPGNALGRVKIVFPNPLAIYFHGTPSRSLFGANERAFSHGCVRVQNIAALAASLVARPDRLTDALAGTQTRGFAPAHAWQATIVYLTLAPNEAGQIVDVGDPYRLDEPLAAALEGRRVTARAPGLHTEEASKPLTKSSRELPTGLVSPSGPDDTTIRSPVSDPAVDNTEIEPSPVPVGENQASTEPHLP